MRQSIKLSILISLFIYSTAPSIAQQNSDWTLIFEDQFNQDGEPDWSKWRYCDRYSSDWNKYLKSSNENVFVKDGKLTLKAFPNTDQQSDPVPYHTGGIETNGKFAFKYGKVEVNAKLCKGKGSWPAIWLMPQKSAGWPAGGEIDIMEHLNFDNFFYATVHSNWHTTMGKTNPTKTATKSFIPSDFNTFGMEWFDDRISFTLNDDVIFTYPRLNTQEAIDGIQWPFDKEFYLILNQAAGGAWVGSITNSDMPFQMEVDWVKIYKKEGESTSLCPHPGTATPGTRGIKKLKIEGTNTIYSTPSGTGANGYFNQKSECAKLLQGSRLDLTFDMQVNSKWAAIAIFIDWNGNGTIDEGETYNPFQTNDSRLGWDNAADYLTANSGAFTITPASDNAVVGFKYPIQVPETTKIGNVVMRIICDEAGQHVANSNKFVCCATDKQYQGGIYDYELKISQSPSSIPSNEANPTTARIVISPNENQIQVANLPNNALCSIINSNGQELSKNIKLSNNQNLSIAHLPKGIYLLRIDHPKGTDTLKFHRN